MNKEEIFDKLKESIGDNCGIKQDSITMESEYESMDVDSLDCIVIIMDMEEVFNIGITDDEAESCKKVSDLVDMIYGKLTDPA